MVWRGIVRVIDEGSTDGTVVFFLVDESVGVDAFASHVHHVGVKGLRAEGEDFYGFVDAFYTCVFGFRG